MTYLKKLLIVIFVFGIAEIIPYGIVNNINNFLNPIYFSIDKHNLFLSTASHRIIQFLISLILLKIFFKRDLSNIGFNLNNLNYSKKIIIKFILIFPFVIFVIFIILNNYLTGFRENIISLYPKNPYKLISDLALNIFMFIPLAEEFLYRSFVIFSLEKYWSGQIKAGRVNIPYVIILSSIIFSLAHINISIFPFRIISYDISQLVYTLLTGFIFSYAFFKTKSLLAPLFLHGYSNIIFTLTAYMTAYIIK